MNQFTVTEGETSHKKYTLTALNRPLVIMCYTEQTTWIPSTVGFNANA